jgi:hypothetical protein
VYLNFEDERLVDMRVSDMDKVLDAVVSRGTRYLYLDEVQSLSGWEKFAHRTLRKVKIFVTGSNSKLLTSSYSKALTGRTKSFEVHPLSYPEFLRFRGSGPDTRTFLDYMRTGGFPRIVMTGDIALAKEYFDRIIYRDITSNSKITDVEALRSIALYLLSNVGKEFSYRSLSSVSGLKHEDTVKSYVLALKDAYLIDVLKKFHPSLKVQQSYGKKAYGADPAFIALGKRRDLDLGRVLENIIFLHLRKKGFDVYYYKNAHEMDFMVCQGLRPLRAVSVTLESGDPMTMKREHSQLEHYVQKMNVPIELVSVYPLEVPEGIDHRLAHRYLME